MARRLLNLQIKEISIVTEGANRRTFALLKHQAEEKMDELKALIEGFTGKKLDEEAIGKAEIADDVKKSLEEQLTLLSKYRDDLPPDVVAAIGKLSHQAAFGVSKSAEDDAKEDGTDDDKKVTVEELVEEVVEKAGKKFSKDTQAILEGFVAKVEELSKAMDALKELMAGQKDKTDDDEEVTPEDFAKMAEERVAALLGKEDD